ncbi:hypothetical protein Leryth_016540 [Lithospermum erythrorhizon]|nr:hypothetical protein Leryth_016540 [Lithospermum erythrorhizon]
MIFMKMFSFIVLLLATIISNPFASFDLVHGASISTICNETLYPDLCNSLIATQPQATTLDQTTLNVRGTSLDVTLAQALRGHSLVSKMDVTLLNVQGKAAWDDCVQLYEDTIELVNRSLKSSNNNNDAQTWLSAAFANQQTCLNGFHDFNLESVVQTLPLFSIHQDISKYLSNSLAINKATKMVSSSSSSVELTNSRGRKLLSHGGAFPEWVSPTDRKLLRSASGAVKADIVVAHDGSGNFRTIREALVAVKKRAGKRIVIYVKRGVYKENVEINKSMKNLMFIGDGIDATIVTGNKNVQDGSTTFRSATFAVSGDGFIARDMTFENTAGPHKHQAVALRSSADFSVFYSCSFKGYQDTLYVHSQRQFYRDCDIHGTIDFIFGDASAILQNCNIYIRKPMSNQKNTVTAQGRADPNENTGIIIHNSHVTAASDFRDHQGSIKSYLGRPWKQYSRTVFMKCVLDGVIDRQGWVPWSGHFALKTLYYGEYMNSGAGAATRGRVKWGGYHVITSPIVASKFSVGNFLAGDSWIPTTGVPFTSGL